MKRILIALFLVLVAWSGFSQDTYSLSSESKLTIDGTSTVHDWTVTAHTMVGVLRAEGNTPKEVDFEVAVEDIKSERGTTMDKKMHAALQKEQHPTVKFTLNELKNGSDFMGTLTIAGKQKDVEIAAKIIADGTTLKISGEYRMPLKDFEIEPPTAMFGQVVVGPDITVTFDLVFKKG